MRISDWSADVCSADLACRSPVLVTVREHEERHFDGLRANGQKIRQVIGTPMAGRSSNAPGRDELRPRRCKAARTRLHSLTKAGSRKHSTKRCASARSHVNRTRPAASAYSRGLAPSKADASKHGPTSNARTADEQSGGAE